MIWGCRRQHRPTPNPHLPPGLPDTALSAPPAVTPPTLNGGPGLEPPLGPTEAMERLQVTPKHPPAPPLTHRDPGSL